MPARIPLDPALPKNFDCTPRDEMNLFSLRQEERDHVEVSPTLDHNRMNLANSPGTAKN